MPEVTLAPAIGWRCAKCDVSVAPALLACPACGTLRHAARLRALATEAERAEGAGEPATAIARWEEALALLPPSAGQHATIAARLEALRAAPASPARQAGDKAGDAGASGKKKTGIGAVLAAIGAVLLKAKFAIFFLLTKAKLLLLGLTKMGTVLTMLASFGVYWTLWGWRFAAGFVLSIYVHEMGHVAALKRRGLAASAPMFIPGVGALVRLRQHPRSEWEDADIGLAGPIWGLAAALAAVAGYYVTRAPVWGAIAQTGAVINLFNLTPVWQLDGARGFHAMSRLHRGIALAVVAAALLVSHEGMLVLVALAAGWQLFTPPAKSPDARAVALYSGLVVALVTVAVLALGMR